MAPRAAFPSVFGPGAVQPLVLVIEDEPQMRRFLVSTLASHGIRSMHVGTRAATLTPAVVNEPDLLLVDISQSSVDGAGLVSRLRQWTSAPILVVLAASAEQDRLSLLDFGATDYLVKPVSSGELVARLRVWLKQSARFRKPRTTHSSIAPPSQAGAGDSLRIDRERRTLTVDGREVHITPLECRILVALVRSPGNFMTEEQIVAAVWGRKARPQRQYLRAHVRQLRQKIESDPSQPRHLVSEAGGGYRLKFG